MSGTMACYDRISVECIVVSLGERAHLLLRHEFFGGMLNRGILGWCRFVDWKLSACLSVVEKPSSQECCVEDGRILALRQRPCDLRADVDPRGMESLTHSLAFLMRTCRQESEQDLWRRSALHHMYPLR